MPGGSARRDVAPRRARDEIVVAPRAARGGFLRGLVQGFRTERGVRSMMGGGVWGWGRVVEMVVDDG